MARPSNGYDDKYTPTDESRKIVRTLYAAGIPIDRICTRLEISQPTLRKYYKADLDDCLDSMIGGMVSNLYQDALSGDKKDREFWLKTVGKLAIAQPVQVVVQSSAAELVAHVNSRGIDVLHGTSEGSDADTE